MADAFLPNPAMNVGFTADVSLELARAYAASFTAPGSALRLDEFTADILHTDLVAPDRRLCAVQPLSPVKVTARADDPCLRDFG